MLSDGRPGHFRLSEGVVQAIQRRRPVDVDYFPVTRRWPLPKGFVPKLARKLRPADSLRFIYGIDAESVPKADLIVSAGGLTLGANTALAAMANIPNVYCGTTRRFSPDRFALVLTDNPAESGPPNVYICPKPCAFDPDKLPSPRALSDQVDGLSVGILIGGPTEFASFDLADWQHLARLIDGLVDRYSAKVVVVTGPRTPDDVHRAVGPLLKQHAAGIVFVDYRVSGPGSSIKALAADLVLVTSDSMTMMTEAALSRRPAIALKPARAATSRDDDAVAWLVSQRWLALCALGTITPEGLLGAACRLQPLEYNHLDLLAEKILPLLAH